jgi:hypothetical protein
METGQDHLIVPNWVWVFVALFAIGVVVAFMKKGGGSRKSSHRHRSRHHRSRRHSPSHRPSKGSTFEKY